MNARFSAWTPEQRANLARVLRGQAEELEQDPELRDMADWMIEACGLTPSPETRQLVLLSSIVVMRNDS